MVVFNIASYTHLLGSTNKYFPQVQHSTSKPLVVILYFLQLLLVSLVIVAKLFHVTLLDCRSQSNFISESLCKCLQLKDKHQCQLQLSCNTTSIVVNVMDNDIEFLVLSRLPEKLPGNVYLTIPKIFLLMFH